MDKGDIVRKVTRPIVTIIFASTISYIVIQGIDAPDWFLVMGNLMVAWWFGDRSIQRLTGKKEEK